MTTGETRLAALLGERTAELGAARDELQAIWEWRASALELEARMAQRTAELNEANNELQALLLTLEHQVQERTAELQARTVELEASRERLVASEKLASLGRLTAGLAHEINTPLAAVMNFLHAAHDLAGEYRDSLDVPTVTPDDHREIAAELGQTLTQAEGAAARIGEFIRRVRDQTRQATAGNVTFDPVRVAQDTLAMLAPQAQAGGVRLHFDPPPAPVSLRGEPGRFAQVLTNLAVNGLHACEGCGTAVTVRLAGQGPEVILEVEDDGCGIAPEVLPRIFDPLFTTKGIGQGTGLGLSIIHDLVKGHFGGGIEVQTRAGEGTRFTVRFPGVQAPVPD